MNDHGHLPDDLADLARRLEAERPAPSGAELERIRQRAMAGEAGSKRSQTTGKVGTTMRPRLAIISMLAVGTLLMGAGTGLAVSGISSDSGDGGEEQYTTTTTSTTETTTSTTETTPPPPGDTLGTTGAGGVQGAAEKGTPDVAQNAQQLEATADTGDSLPFTGFAAIPVIAVGVGLLAGGLAMRRRSS